MTDVVFVPELTTNLFSITKAMENGSDLSNEGKIMVLTKGTKKIKFDDLQSTKKGYSGGIIICTRSEGENAHVTMTKTINYQDVHGKLGHPGQETTRATAASLGWTIAKEKGECESCPIAKARQKNVNQVADNKVTSPGQLMSSDISSIRTDSSTGRKYWLLVVDNYTGMKWSFFLRTKDEQADVLVSFVKQIPLKYMIERWRFDNAEENKATQKAFEENKFGIKVEFTACETPQQNGTVERAFATLYGRVCAMFIEAGFETLKKEQYWPECVATATKLDNILVSSNKDTSPYKQFYGTPSPIREHLRTFGEIGIVTRHNNQPIRGKLDDRGVPCVFLGYAKDHSANVYRMLKLDTNAVIITRDIVWLKKMYYEYMGMTKIKKYNVEEDKPTDNESVINLIEDMENEGDDVTDKEQEGNSNN